MKEIRFYDFDFQLIEQGYKAQKWPIVDAGFFDVPKHRNNKKDNEKI